MGKRLSKTLISDNSKFLKPYIITKNILYLSFYYVLKFDTMYFFMDFLKILISIIIIIYLNVVHFLQFLLLKCSKIKLKIFFLFKKDIIIELLFLLSIWHVLGSMRIYNACNCIMHNNNATNLHSSNQSNWKTMRAFEL